MDRQMNTFSAQENAAVKDDDVKAEEARVSGLSPESTAVQVKKARKTFGFLRAVDNLSFSVNYGDVFALLGVNGAGKTTAFKMLTREEKPNCGEFHIQGTNMYSSEFAPGRKSIGYCPQDNVLFDVLTVKEHLKFFATIKGVPPVVRDEVVDHILISMNLESEANKQAFKLSGGNKRKLCTAIALIGYPSVLVLDEPTTGLDPKNRRDLWKVIEFAANSAKPRCGVVLTSHSMEEVEALATKVGIMVKGNFRCFGPVQHLKTKYGDSYDVEFKPALPQPEAVQTRVGAQAGKVAVSMSDAQGILQTAGLEEQATLLTSHDQRASHINDKLIRGTGVKAETLIEFGLVEEAAKTVKQQVTETFGGFELVEHSLSKLKIRVPHNSQQGRPTTFSQLFAFAEKLVFDFAYDPLRRRTRP